MHKEVFDVQICFSHKVHVLGYLKTQKKKSNYIFQLNSQLEGKFKNVTHANF